MTSVWKRLQRVNQRASKFCFSIQVTEVQLETVSGAQPKLVSVLWTRRSRRLATSNRPWEPSLQNPMKGLAIWTSPENLEASITLFKNPRSDDFEDKEWKFVVEDPSVRTKRRQLGMCSFNMKNYATFEPSQQIVTLNLTPMSKKVVCVTIKIRISCVFLKEGKATDEDLQSLASLMSTSTYGDIAPLDDFDEEDDMGFDESKEKELRDLTSQILSLTSSVSDNTLKDCPTPIEEEAPNDILDPSLPNSRPNRLSIIVPNLIKSDTQKFERQASIPETPEVPEEPRLEIRSPQESCTSGQDLLEWCKLVTKDCNNLKLSNFTTSWKNGLGFCAIISHFRPDLIDYSSLSEADAKQNCRLAFDAGDVLGVPRVLDPNDMVQKRLPDKLMVMTYLHQLKAYFTNHQTSLDEIGNEMHNYRSEVESSSEKCVDTVEIRQKNMESLFRGSSFDEARRKLTTSNSEYLLRSSSQDSDGERKSVLKGVRESLVTKSKSFTNKLASFGESLKEKTDNHGKLCEPPKKSLGESQSKLSDGQHTPTEEMVLSMTREQYADPLGSFEEEPSIVSPSSPGSPASYSSDVSEGASREEILKARARELIEKSKADIQKPKKPPQTKEEEERQQQLRERARKIIAEAKAGLPAEPRSPTLESILPPMPKSRSRSRDGSQELGKRSGSSTPVIEFKINMIETKRRTPTPDKESSPGPKLKSLYIEKEIEILEREQAAIDKEAADIEKKLRKAMDTVPNVPEEEERLLHSWFLLVNKKNALIRRLEQLNILEKEQDLERRYQMLNEELRSLMSVDESEKTEEVREREALLLQELVGIVNKRDELVQHMDEHERAIDDDDAIERELSIASYRNQEDKNCVIQ